MEVAEDTAAECGEQGHTIAEEEVDTTDGSGVASTTFRSLASARRQAPPSSESTKDGGIVESGTSSKIIGG